MTALTMCLTENEQCVLQPADKSAPVCAGCIFDKRGVHGVLPEAGNTGCWQWDCTRAIVVLRTASPNVRTSDPYTSHAAAASVKPKRASIKDHILLELAIHGGCTGTEIANRCAIRLNSITPRFAELSGKKYATRRCISLKNVPETERKIKASGERRDGQIVWVLA